MKEKVYKEHNYSVPLLHQDAIAREIERILNMNIIEPSHSYSISPIVPIIKKHSEIRLCLKACKTNKIKVPDFEQYK